VVTQYLLDLVNDQGALAAEINRVLVPNGLWINFGLPLCQTAVDMVTHLDPSTLLRRRGFDARDVSLVRSAQLDLGGVGDLAGKVVQTHVFFVARKSHSIQPAAESSFCDYFAGRTDSLLRRKVRLSKRFVFGVGRETRFAQGGAEPGHLLEI